MWGEMQSLIPILSGQVKGMVMKSPLFFYSSVDLMNCEVTGHGEWAKKLHWPMSE